MVEQFAVNEKVAGSSPASGAMKLMLAFLQTGARFKPCQ